MVDSDLELRPLGAQDALEPLSLPTVEPRQESLASTDLFSRKGPWMRTLFTPEFLVRKPDHATPQLRSTAYLDGLRGVAAFIVYIAHSEAWNHDVERLQAGFGAHGNRTFVTLPFVRVFITGGHAAVAVFFVISGYVLSRRPLALIHQKSETLYGSLASSVFRRAVRLYFPFIAITLLFLTTWHVFGLDIEWPKPQPTFLLELRHWWSEFSQFVYPFRTPSDDWFSYDFPLWTIPVEFQGSILIFTTLLGLSRVSPKARCWVVVAMGVYFLSIGGWQLFCFLAGLLLAELDLLVAARRHTLFDHSILRQLSGHERKVCTVIFVLAMYLASQPSSKDKSVATDTPGWAMLVSMVPSIYLSNQWWRFWLAIAAPMLVMSVGRLPLLHSALECRFAQYLGRISFALYLVHIPVAITIGDKIFRVFGYVRPLTPSTGWDGLISVPRFGPLGFETDFIVPQLFILPITFYISEIAMRALDLPSITLGLWAYRKLKVW